MSQDTRMKRRIAKISELETKKIIQASEKWCAWRGSTWVECNEDILNYDYHIRAIFWDTESAEIIAIGYVAVQPEGQDELMIEDDWFTITLYEDPITLEIDADGEMDGMVDKNWEILFKSQNKPSWLDEDEDLKI